MTQTSVAVKTTQEKVHSASELSCTNDVSGWLVDNCQSGGACVIFLIIGL